MPLSPATPASSAIKLVLVDGLRRCYGNLRAGEQALIVERRKQIAARLKRAEPVEAHGVQALENIAVLSVLRDAPMPFDEPLYLLEARDDALLAWRTPAFLLRLCKFGKLLRGSSRLRSLIAAFLLVTHESGGPFGHALFPCVLRVERREPPRSFLKRNARTARSFASSGATQFSFITTIDREAVSLCPLASGQSQSPRSCSLLQVPQHLACRGVALRSCFFIPKALRAWA